jgi:uncharacterized delta-60 repeat protein
VKVERAWDITTDDDGKVFVTGYTMENSMTNIFLLKLNPDGTLDSDFGVNGVSQPVFDGNEMGMSLALQDDGKILVTGGLFHFAVSRYLPNGDVDSEFGEDGITINKPGTGFSFSHSVALQSDGKIIVGGYADNDDSDDFVVQRYHAEGSGGISEDNSVFQNVNLYPNPAPGTSITLDYYLSQKQDITIELISLDGKLISVLLSKEQRAKGNNKEPLTLPANITSGSYLIRISTKNSRETLKLEIN